MPCLHMAALVVLLVLMGVYFICILFFRYMLSFLWMTQCHYVLHEGVCGHAPAMRTTQTVTAVLALDTSSFFFNEAFSNRINLLILL